MQKKIDKPSQLNKLSTRYLRHKAEKESSELPALQAAAEKAATSVLAGVHAQRKPGMGEKFWQFREYDPADRPQDIDWRMSARTDRVYVREKEWQTTQSALFWIQHNKAMLFRSNKNIMRKLENGIVLALGMANLLTMGHEKIGLLSGDMTSGRTDRSLQTLAEELSTKSTSSLPSVDIERTPKNSHLIMIGDFLSSIEQIEKGFSNLASRSKNGMIFQVLDPAELNLPYEGRVIFEEASPKETHHIQNVSSIRIPYQERINAHLEAVRQICKKHGWHWILHRTDVPISETLFDAWTMSARNQSPSKGLL